MINLIDTHTHFDIPEYDDKRVQFTQNADKNGVRHLLLIGYLAKYFERMVLVNQAINALKHAPRSHLAFGLHPLYINEQHDDDLGILEDYLNNYPTIAMGEIGLDTYAKPLKQPDIFQKQNDFLLSKFSLPKRMTCPFCYTSVKNHADVLKILAEQNYHAHDRVALPIVLAAENKRHWLL